MASVGSWGCCDGGADKNEKKIDCMNCSKSYHFACLSIPVPDDNTEILFLDWICPQCAILKPKSSKQDSTPVRMASAGAGSEPTPTRNVTTTRGNKRLAPNSPPSPPLSPTDTGLPVTRADVRNILEEIMKKEFSEMLRQLSNSMIRQLEPIKKEMREINESMAFMNARFEEIESQNAEAKKTMMELETENSQMKSTIMDLTVRMNYLEQQSRSNNLEIQCVPENKNENLITIINQIGNIVGCDIQESSILHCTRVAKLSATSTRPRSIVVQLASTRIRDQLLASTLKFNKANPQDKLNSAHLGFAGNKTPIFIVEHLSPTNKALHAAARLKAKEKVYKFVWVRNGRVFVRKSEDSEYIYVKSMDCLSKII